MDAIKILIILICFPMVIYAQKAKFPKDTIYLLYTDTIFSNKKMKAKSQHIFNEEVGIKFWWKGYWMFYNCNSKTDTLPIFKLNDYVTIDSKEVTKRHNKWINELYNGQRKPPANKNGAFKTYLIEVICKDKFVIYPVVWRNEGVTGF